MFNFKSSEGILCSSVNATNYSYKNVEPLDFLMVVWTYVIEAQAAGRSLSLRITSTCCHKDVVLRRVVSRTKQDAKKN